MSSLKRTGLVGVAISFLSVAAFAVESNQLRRSGQPQPIPEKAPGINHLSPEVLINDGSFENGPPPASAWTEVTSTPCEWIGDWSAAWGVGAYDGLFDIWAGGYCGGVPTTTSVTQAGIAIPVSDNDLHFRYISFRPDDDDPVPDDFGYLEVNGTPVWTLDFTQANDTFPAWVEVVIPMAAYAGQNVTLEFGGVSTGASTGNIRFDFIEVGAPGGGGGGTCDDYDVVIAGGAAIVPGTVMVPGSNCDDCSNNVALPFPFDFYGTTFNSVNAISNGSLQFSSANATFTNVCPLPVVGFNNTIFAYWDDLLLISAGQGIFTSTSGVAPNRIFNVEWRAGYFSGGGSANFEIRLYETTNQIEFIYGTVTQGIASATGGLQRGTGPTVEPLFCNGSGQAITSGLTVLYTCVATGCTLTCPANVTQGNDPAQCGAAVTLPPTGGTCTNATCAPPSGSFFPVGTTTVTCSDPAAPAPCSFTVTVDDLEPPVLVCPADIVEDLAPGETEGVASWADPGVSDNCPGVGSPTCVPPSGSLFPAGTTPVDCSATDAAGNSGACSFNVTLNLVSILEIPTASTWGLAALALLLAAAAFFALRRTA